MEHKAYLTASKAYMGTGNYYGCDRSCFISARRFLFIPLALGSYWAILPFLLTIPWTVIRIKIEEEALLHKLPGYRDYCLKTNKRLIPFIW